MSVLLFTLFGCTNDTSDKDTDQFANDSSIRITEPNNGDVLDAEFVLKYEAGADIETLKLELDNEAYSHLDITEDSTTLTLDAGSHKISIIGFDEDSTWLSETSITITVDGEDLMVMKESDIIGIVSGACGTGGCCQF